MREHGDINDHELGLTARTTGKGEDALLYSSQAQLESRCEMCSAMCVIPILISLIRSSSLTWYFRRSSRSFAASRKGSRFLFLVNSFDCGSRGGVG